MNVYNLTKSKSNFHGVYWITVSHDSNIYHLQSEFARALKVDFMGEDDQIVRAGILSEALSKIGCFVLFLDDVWSYFQLEKLGIHDKMSTCKLVLTSRSLEVCRRMDCQPCFKINPLPESEAWNLFMEKFGNEVEISGEILQIAQSITEECGGLPLAIIALASSMKGVDDIREWKYCLRMLKEGKEGPESMDLEVYPVLKLSYDRLKDEQLQQCLLYCAVYPEDYMIKRRDLINLFYDISLIEDGSREAQFDRGHVILNKLENVCLLEKPFHPWLSKEHVKMHDLIRDMALRITRSTFMVKSGLSLKELLDAEEEWGSELEVVSLMGNKIEEISFSPNCPRLSTLLLNGSEYYQIRRIHNRFFYYLLGLKVLDLSTTDIWKLPNSVANLVNLRALILSGCRRLVSLPSVAKLSSLRRLDLYMTPIKELPQGMENLVNLKYLHLWCPKLKKIRAGIFPNLSKLCFLWIRWPRGDIEVIKRGDLGCLQKLETFRVYFGGWDEYTAFAKSEVKPNRYYVMNYIPIYHPLRDDEDDSERHFTKTVTLSSPDFEVSCMLPLPLPEDAEQLTFGEVCYGKSLDELFLPLYGVGNLKYCKAFSSIKYLYISRCGKLRKLLLLTGGKLLENLQNLEELTVFYCRELREIIASEEEAKVMRSKAASKNELDTIITLPKLKCLKLDFLQNLESISTRTLVCDSLEKLEIKNCPKLKRIPFSLKSSINGQLSPPSSLKNIRVGEKTVEEAKEWWESLQWDDPQAKTALQPYVICSVADQ